MTLDAEALAKAAEVIAEADAILIGAGAGIGVDSGLPDFRGNEGFWNAYPPFRKQRLSFVDMANPSWFDRDPRQAWGFYGHRMNLYRETVPHAGFGILLEWMRAKPESGFVFTSNVDGQFQKAGFDEDAVVECHGSIHHMQCCEGCDEIWPADDVELGVDEETFRAVGPLPKCPVCGRLARPNILMFGDWAWLSGRTGAQQQRYQQWLRRVRDLDVAIIECGAGRAVPTVRLECRARNGTLIRINPREPQVPAGGIGLPMGTLETVTRIAELLDA